MLANERLKRGLVRLAAPALGAASTLVDENQALGAVIRHELARARSLAGEPRAALEVASRVAAVADAGESDLAARARLLLASAAKATADWQVAAGHVDWPAAPTATTRGRR